MRDLLEAGVHFGHQTRRWNPKMRRFIFAERGGIYIIDLTQTSERLDEAQQFLRNVAERGGTVLFVGTKKQAQDAVEQEAKRIGMPYVNHRWLGGLLTNWRTMADRIDRLHELRRQRDEGQLELLPAKERISLGGELEKLEANLGGVADMRRQPDAVVILDLKKEALAVREARRLGVPVVALVDTNCDPDEADYVIPGNDDAIRSCNLVVRALAEAVSDGKQKVSARELQQQQQQQQQAEEAPAESAPEGDVEQVSAGEQIEPVTEGESVPVPTGADPAKEGAEVTKASEAALGAGSVAGEADDARPEDPGDPTKAGSVAGAAADAQPEDPAASGGSGGEAEEA
jgi:small subunit ribosomal protein S2